MAALETREQPPHLGGTGGHRHHGVMAVVGPHPRPWSRPGDMVAQGLGLHRQCMVNFLFGRIITLNNACILVYLSFCIIMSYINVCVFMSRYHSTFKRSSSKRQSLRSRGWFGFFQPGWWPPWYAPTVSITFLHSVMVIWLCLTILLPY